MQPAPVGKYRYEVFGPFPFSTKGNMRHRKALKQFWTDRLNDGSPEGLCDALGVYVWTFRQGKRRIPWNVGITSRPGFKGRFALKEASFLRFQRDNPNAEIEVYLLARRTRGGEFSRTNQTKLNDWLESILIGSALSVNPALANSAKTKYLRTAVVDGYLNDQAVDRNAAARSFNAIFKHSATESKSRG